MKWGIILVLYIISSETNIATLPTAACNPSLDLLFTLGSVSYRHFAERIIGDLSRHPLPDYTVRTGLSVCKNASAAFIPMSSDIDRVLTSLKSIAKHPTSGSGSSHEHVVRFSDETCLHVSADIFQRIPRRNATKIMVFVTDGYGWRSNDYTRKATEMKRKNVTVVTIGVGIKQIDVSRDLENMATDDGKFFIIKDANLLPSLTSMFSKGPCQLLEVNISALEKSEKLEPQIKTLPPSPIKPVAGCHSRRLNATHYEEVRMIPGFGSLKQVLTCSYGQIYDVARCRCY